MKRPSSSGSGTEMSVLSGRQEEKKSRGREQQPSKELYLKCQVLMHFRQHQTVVLVRGAGEESAQY